MRTLVPATVIVAILLFLSGCSSMGGKLDPADAAKIDRDVDATLKNLYAK